jgi:hypothetical protein
MVSFMSRDLDPRENRQCGILGSRLHTTDPSSRIVVGNSDGIKPVFYRCLHDLPRCMFRIFIAMGCWGMCMEINLAIL